METHAFGFWLPADALENRKRFPLSNSLERPPLSSQLTALGVLVDGVPAARLQNKLSNENLEAAEIYQDASMNWTTFFSGLFGETDPIVGIEVIAEPALDGIKAQAGAL